jgi:hypothetical protein
MDDLHLKLLRSSLRLVKPKQPSLGEMNRDVYTATSKIPKPTVTVPKTSYFELEKRPQKYTETFQPLPTSDNIYTLGINGTPDPKDVRETTYVNNNYAGDDYVD